jgi:Mce-associated membrane protein
VLVTVASVLVVVLMVANVLLTLWTRDQRRTDEARTEALQAARLAVTALTTRDVDETERLEAATSRLLSDRFRPEYLESRAESLAAPGGRNLMVTTNATRAAAERITQDSAVVLVSADAMRSRGKGKQQGLAHYRFLVTLVHRHGAWLVDDLVAV